MAKNIAIDRAKRLHEEAHKGHNRWHPDISPVIEAEPMEEVAIETRDASDGQIRPGMHAEDVAKIVPDPAGAAPASGAAAKEGLRTIPPRENCGNADVKQLAKGSKLFVPVNVEGALYSVGDGHFAQGDSECCGTAIEMGATCVVRFRVHRGEAARKRIVWPRFAHPGYFATPEVGMPKNFIATMGMPVHRDGPNEGVVVSAVLPEAIFRG